MSDPEQTAEAPSSTANASAARREPQQQRSQQRVASILDAAGKLLEEVGYGALTTNAIARRAGTSIGSLYQFFPNKAAVLSRLADSFRVEVTRTLGKIFNLETARRSTIALVNLFIDGIEEVQRRTPGFSYLFSATKLDDAPADDASHQLEREIMEPLDRLLAEAYPEVPQKQRRICLRMITETSKVLIANTRTLDPASQELLRTEVKRMLGLYVASYFGPKTASGDHPSN